jgi:hypothetical protein
MLGGNLARAYAVDTAALASVVDAIGPTPQRLGLAG